MDNFNSIPGTIGRAENSPISSHQGFVLLSIAPWREGKLEREDFQWPCTDEWICQWWILVQLWNGVLQWSCFSGPSVLVWVLLKKCEQGSSNDKDREWKRKKNTSKRQTKRFLKINDYLNVWAMQFSSSTWETINSCVCAVLYLTLGTQEGKFPNTNCSVN